MVYRCDIEEFEIQNPRVFFSSMGIILMYIGYVVYVVYGS